MGEEGRPGVVVNLAVGERERRVPGKFARALEIVMHDVEPRAGKLVILECGDGRTESGKNGVENTDYDADVGIDR